MTPPITADNVTRVVLENGIVVLVKENHTNASVSLRGRLRAGAMYDTDETSGLAQFTAAALVRGTRRYTFQKLNEKFDQAGMSFGVGSGTEIVSFGGKSLTEDFDALLNIAEQVLRAPTFPSREVEKLRGQFVTGLREAQQDTRWVAFKNFRALTYPQGHPFHRTSDGTEEIVKGLTREQLAEFHARYYRPAGAIFVVVGDVQAKKVIEKIRKRFGAWENNGRIPFEIPEAPALTPAAPQRESFVVPGKLQADVVMGYPGIRRNDSDYYALRTGDLIFGQLGLSGRLGESVRDQMGLAYYVYSSLDAGIGAGPWMINTGVNPKNVERAIEAIEREIARLSKSGVTQDELRHAQDFLSGSLALRLETNEGVASMLADIELHGLGLDYVERYPSIIRGLTAEQIHAAVARHTHLESVVTVVAGPGN